MIDTEKKIRAGESRTTECVCRPISGGHVPTDDELARRRGAIAGMERRLMVAPDVGADTADTVVAREVLTRHYATYAHGVIDRLGGDVAGMHALTNRDYVVPLARGPAGLGAMD